MLSSGGQLPSCVSLFILGLTTGQQLNRAHTLIAAATAWSYFACAISISSDQAHLDTPLGTQYDTAASKMSVVETCSIRTWGCSLENG